MCDCVSQLDAWRNKGVLLHDFESLRELVFRKAKLEISIQLIRKCANLDLSTIYDQPSL